MDSAYRYNTKVINIEIISWQNVLDRDYQSWQQDIIDTAKTKNFYKLLLTFSLFFLALGSFTTDFKQYNIYLIPANTADKYIKEFDDSLAETNVLKKYKTYTFYKKPSCASNTLPDKF